MNLEPVPNLNGSALGDWLLVILDDGQHVEGVVHELDRDTAEFERDRTFAVMLDVAPRLEAIGAGGIGWSEAYITSDDNNRPALLWTPEDGGESADEPQPVRRVYVSRGGRFTRGQ